MKTFGERLQVARNEKKIKQAELALKLGVAKSTISNWEHNTNSPDIDMVVQICNFLDVSSDYLFGKSQHMNPKKEWNAFRLENPGKAKEIDENVNAFLFGEEDTAKFSATKWLQAGLSEMGFDHKVFTNDELDALYDTFIDQANQYHEPRNKK